MQIQPWNLVFVIGLIVFSCIRGVFIQRAKGKEKTVSRAGVLEKTLLAMGFLVIPLLILYLFTPWLAFADYRLPVFAPWCGTALMLAALWLVYRAHADLGQNWSVTLELRQGHQLVTQGVYRSIRHPMYASFWLLSLAQGLLLENWLAGWYSFVGFAFMYFLRVPREEQMMCESFGQEYRDYMRRTGRVIPRFNVGRGA